MKNHLMRTTNSGARANSEGTQEGKGREEAFLQFFKIRVWVPAFFKQLSHPCFWFPLFQIQLY